jgi:hypothetical protein
MAVTGRFRCRSDDGGDVAERDGLVGDSVQPRAGGCFFQRQPEQVRGIQSVHGAPPVGPVTGVRRDTLAAGDADDGWDEAVIALAVHGQWEPHHGYAYCTSGKRHRRRLGGRQGIERPGLRHIPVRRLRRDVYPAGLRAS